MFTGCLLFLFAKSGNSTTKASSLQKKKKKVKM